MTTQAYDPRKRGLLSYHDSIANFRDETDTPARYLERCLEIIAAREPMVRAFVSSNLAAAMIVAEAATKRYREGAPLSSIDGMPIAIKDIFETFDAPTGWGSTRLAENPGVRDAAIIRALRKGGAAIIGKTALPELGFGPPPATTNPWDDAHTPGGSSSGSAAAVGAAMIPVAIGTQGKGSLTRPASYCGVYGFKPGHGTIHRGGDGGSQETNTHVGALAGSLEDAWITAHFLSAMAGPHPGSAGIIGPASPPEATKPHTFIRMDGPGWAKTSDGAKAAYESLIDAIARVGIIVADAGDNPAHAALERDMTTAADALSIIADHESRWPLIMYLERDRDEGHPLPHGRGFDPLTHERGFARADVSAADYADALNYRKEFRTRLATLRRDGLFFISPAATEAAPKGLSSTGSAVYQWASSLAGNPVISLPLMATDGLPLSLQIQGFVGEEADLCAAARWIDSTFRAGEI